jgi:hypothetical protein
MVGPMEPTPRHQAAEARFRALITSADLAQPDGVEYTPDSLIFRWEGPKVAVVVDLDDPPSDYRAECGAEMPSSVAQRV